MAKLQRTVELIEKKSGGVKKGMKRVSLLFISDLIFASSCAGMSIRATLTTRQ